MLFRSVKVEPLGLEEINSRLRQLEEKFGVPSERFVEAFSHSPLQEEPEFHEWSRLLAARKLIERRPA